MHSQNVWNLYNQFLVKKGQDLARKEGEHHSRFCAAFEAVQYVLTENLPHGTSNVSDTPQFNLQAKLAWFLRVKIERLEEFNSNPNWKSYTETARIKAWKGVLEEVQEGTLYGYAVA